MKAVGRVGFVCLAIMSLALPAQATVTMRVSPANSMAEAGDVLTFDVTLESDEGTFLRAYQVTLPCSATPVGGATGSIDHLVIPPMSMCTGNPGDQSCNFGDFMTTCMTVQCVTVLPDPCGNGMPATCIPVSGVIGVCLNQGTCRRPSPTVDTGRPDFVFPPPLQSNIGLDSGLCPTPNTDPRVANSLPSGSSNLLLPGVIYYLSTFKYKISLDAMGEFTVPILGVNNPPTENDRTRLRDVANQLVSFTAVSGTVMVTGQSCTMDADCSDGLFCNGDEMCVSNVCQPGDVRDCDDLLSCTTDSCNEAMDRCDNIPNDAACNDGILCNGTETCNPTSGNPPTGCVAGTPVVCNDNRTCTIDQCSPATGLCQFIPNNAMCNDGNACNGTETCNPATGDPTTGCTMGTPVVCNDNRTCTDDSCNMANGSCIFTPVNARCDDGMFCTGMEVCNPATGDPTSGCVMGSDPCTVDEICDEPGDRCVDCLVNGDCDDGMFCNGMETCQLLTGMCQAGTNPCAGNQTCNEANDMCEMGPECTVPGDCADDGNPCTTTVCTSGMCGHVNNTLPCDDGMFCNGSDMCMGGSCSMHSGNPCSGGTPFCDEGVNMCFQCQINSHCEDTNACTNNVCSSGSCTFPPNNDPCDDGLFCNGTDTCSGGTCQHSGDPCAGAGMACNENTNTCVDCDMNSDCNDGDPCTVDTCNGSGMCVFSPAPNSTPCDDGLFCTLTDLCNGGVCIGSGNRCPGQECDENANACVQCLMDADCDDGNDCTTDTCVGGTCNIAFRPNGSACGSNADTACDNPDTCNGTGTCLANNEPNNTPCADALFCNGAESCQAGQCVDRADPCVDQAHCSEAADVCLACINNGECNDQNACTTDACVANVCVNTPIQGCILDQDIRAGIDHKGSLVIFSKVEIRFVLANNQFVLYQDTFLDLTNDYPEDVNVQLYFVNGDGPLAPVFVGTPPVLVERGHPGWNWVDCQILLTANQPTYWSAFNGQPAGCQPFTILDPGFPPGRPDPNLPGGRMLRGYVIGWAVDSQGREINWNHLKGDAVVIDYLRGSAFEYNTYNFRALSGALGGQTDGTPGRLNLDGVEFEFAPDRLLLDFYAVNSLALSNRDFSLFALVNTSLTLYPVSVDLRQDTTGPVVTKAKFDIWNENEARFSGTEKCISCWDQTLLSQYPAPNQFVRSVLQTDKGQARIDGEGSTQCPLSINAAILGLSVKHVAFFNLAALTGFGDAAMSIVGQGDETAVIRYDIIAPPDELQIVEPVEPQPPAPAMPVEALPSAVPTVRPSRGK